MSSKNNFFSRQETQCDHCGLKVSRHNIAAHTRNVHPNQKVKERAQKQKTLDHLLTVPTSKKIRLEEEKENVVPELPEVANIIEKEKDKGENNVIIKKLEEVQATVLKSLDDIRTDISDLKNDKQNDYDNIKDQEHSAIDNARTISEIITACPEFEHITDKKYIKCKLCVDEAIFNLNNEASRQTIGVIKYNDESTQLRERTDLMDREFRNIKISVKKHLNSHIHKEHVMKIEKKSRDLKGRDDLRNNKAAAMRCARICYGLYRKGRPFTDYPEIVATIVAGGTFMGEINHSKEFASTFLNSVANVVRDKVKHYLKSPLDQTGFKPPIKIVADKDTIKHRTRQIIALTKFFPEADDLIQTLYVTHPIVKHHSGQDVADHLHTNLEEYLSQEQYQGGSYDGAYFHQSVPKYMGEKYNVDESDVKNDHDFLHKCGICEKNVRKKKENEWATLSGKLCATCFNDFNYGKEYEELKQIADDMDIDFKSPKFHSETRFANSSSKVFNTFFTDLPAIIERYRDIKNENKNSNLQKKRDKASHANDMLKKIDNKKFLLSQAGLCDIYSVFSVVVCDLQKVNQLPFERYDEFQKKLQTFQKMTETVSDHSKCDETNCTWPKLHYHKSDITSGKFCNHIIITSNEPETTIFTRSVAKQLSQQSSVSYESIVYEHLTTYITTLYQELSTVFDTKDRECIEISRCVTDWGALAIKLQTRSVPLIYTLENVNFVESCKKIDRNLRIIHNDDIEEQFNIFLKRLHSVTKTKPIKDLENSDPKEIIKYFMQHEHLYSGIEFIMQATAVACIKLSVESIAESYISIYNLHNSDIRPINDENAEDEMTVHLNGPVLGEADGILKAALDKHFKGGPWHFTIQNNIFRTSGQTVQNILSRKSKLPFYN